MALNREDANRVSYKAKIEWYKERFTAIQAAEDILFEPPEKDYTPKELIQILEDLAKKGRKLSERIDSVSEKLSIPIDKTKNPEISEAVNFFDSASKGEYLSYSLYKRLLDLQTQAIENLDVNELLENAVGDPDNDSMMIKDAIISGMAKSDIVKTLTQPPPIPGDNSLERYANRYLNNIFSWNEHEYKIRQILNFADNYLGTFPDPAYVPWYVKPDVNKEVVDVTSLASVWKHFSKDYNDDVSGLVGGIKGLTELRPDDKLTSATEKVINYTNHFLNSVSSIFDTNYTADLLCCFFLWAGKLDLRTLKGLRALIQLLQSGLSLEFRDIFNSLKDILNNIFRGIIMHHVMALINHIFQRLLDPIKKWLNTPDPRWQKIFVCTPIDEFINKFIVEALEYIQDLLAKLLKNFYKQIELQSIKNELKLVILSENKTLSILAKMLDTVIAVLEKSAICGTGSSPNEEDLKKMIDSYGLGEAEPYQYPIEENPNIYNSFISIAPTTEVEEVISAAEKRTTKQEKVILSPGIGTSEGPKIDECLKKILPEDVIQVTEWIEKINAKSQESK
jgi:hypothetical protein